MSLSCACASPIFGLLKPAVRIAALMVSLLVLGVALRMPIAYAFYFADQEGFIERLCENKDKPEMQCDGKCYLSKVLKQTSKEEPDQPAPLPEWKETLLYFSPIPILKIHRFTRGEPARFHYRNSYSYTVAANVFHPPQRQVYIQS